MKRPTQADVARLAGVSRATVSFVLNGQTAGPVSISADTHRRVLAAVEELGYVPDARAQALRSGSTKTIGLILPDIHNPHFWEYADGIEQEARRAGYHLLLSSMDLNPDYAKETLEALAHRRVDGLILMGSYVDHSDEAMGVLNELLRRQLPVVEISDRPHVEHGIDRIVVDYTEATAQVMAHLLALGHRRIGLIYGVAQPDLGDDRRQPYRRSLAAAGLPLDERLVVECGPAITDGYAAAAGLLAGAARPTALIAINDLLAVAALRAAADAGLAVPAGLSVVGYDDIPLAAYLTPRLTTVSKEPQRLGRQAVRLLLARIHDPEQPRHSVQTSARFIVRESTGPPPQM